MSDILKQYKVKITADTEEFLKQLNSLESATVKKLKGLNLSEGLQHDVEALSDEIKEMRKILTSSTDGMKNDFNSISTSVLNLNSKIDDLQDSMRILTSGGIEDGAKSIGNSFKKLSDDISDVIGKFKTTYEVINKIQNGQVDISGIVSDSSISKTKNKVKSVEELVSELTENVGRLQKIKNRKTNNIDQIVGLDTTDDFDAITAAKHIKTLTSEIIKSVNKLSKVPALDLSNIFKGIKYEDVLYINEDISDYLDEQIHEAHESVKKSMPGKIDTEVRFKINLDEDVDGTATVDSLVRKVNDVVESAQKQVKGIKIPIGYTTDVSDITDKKELEKAESTDTDKYLIKNINLEVKANTDNLVNDVNSKIADVNETLKATGRKIEVEVIGKVNPDTIENAAKDIAYEVEDAQHQIANNLNVRGGNISIDSSSGIATESTLSNIYGLLSGWNSGGIPGTQSEEFKKELKQKVIDKQKADDFDQYFRMKNLRANRGKHQYDQNETTAMLMAGIAINDDARAELTKLIRSTKLKKGDESILTGSRYFTSSFTHDGVEYATFGDGKTTLKDWQDNLLKLFRNSFKEGKTQSFWDFEEQRPVIGADGKEITKKIKVKDETTGLMKEIDEVVTETVKVKGFLKQERERLNRSNKSKRESLKLNGVQYKKDEKGSYTSEILYEHGTVTSNEDAYAKSKKISQLIVADAKEEASYQQAKKNELIEQRSIMHEIYNLENKSKTSNLSDDESLRLEELKTDLKERTKFISDSDREKYEQAVKEYNDLNAKFLENGTLSTKDYFRKDELEKEIHSMFTSVDDISGYVMDQLRINTETGMSIIDQQIKDVESNIKKIVKTAGNQIGHIYDPIENYTSPFDKSGEKRSPYTKAIIAEMKKAEQEGIDISRPIKSQAQYEWYTKKLAEIDAEQARFSRLITQNPNKQGKSSFDYSAMTDEEKAKYFSNNEYRQALLTRIHLYEEQNNLEAELLGEQKKLNTTERANISDLRVSQVDKEGYERLFWKRIHGDYKNDEDFIRNLSDSELNDALSSTTRVIDAIDKNTKLSDKEIQILVQDRINEDLAYLRKSLQREEAELIKMEKEPSKYSKKAIDNQKYRVNRIHNSIEQLEDPNASTASQKSLTEKRNILSGIRENQNEIIQQMRIELGLTDEQISSVKELFLLNSSIADVKSEIAQQNKKINNSVIGEYSDESKGIITTSQLDALKLGRNVLNAQLEEFEDKKKEIVSKFSSSGDVNYLKQLGLIEFSSEEEAKLSKETGAYLNSSIESLAKKLGLNEQNIESLRTILTLEHQINKEELRNKGYQNTIDSSLYDQKRSKKGNVLIGDYQDLTNSLEYAYKKKEKSDKELDSLNKTKQEAIDKIVPSLTNQIKEEIRHKINALQKSIDDGDISSTTKLKRDEWKEILDSPIHIQNLVEERLNTLFSGIKEIRDNVEKEKAKIVNSTGWKGFDFGFFSPDSLTKLFSLYSQEDLISDEIFSLKTRMLGFGIGDIARKNYRASLGGKTFDPFEDEDGLFKNLREVRQKLYTEEYSQRGTSSENTARSMLSLIQEELKSRNKIKENETETHEIEKKIVADEQKRLSLSKERQQKEIDNKYNDQIIDAEKQVQKAKEKEALLEKKLGKASDKIDKRKKENAIAPQIQEIEDHSELGLYRKIQEIENKRLELRKANKKVTQQILDIEEQIKQKKSEKYDDESKEKERLDYILKKEKELESLRSRKKDQDKKISATSKEGKNLKKELVDLYGDKSGINTEELFNKALLSREHFELIENKYRASLNDVDSDKEEVKMLSEQLQNARDNFVKDYAAYLAKGAYDIVEIVSNQAFIDSYNSGKLNTLEDIDKLKSSIAASISSKEQELKDLTAKKLIRNEGESGKDFRNRQKAFEESKPERIAKIESEITTQKQKQAELLELEKHVSSKLQFEKQGQLKMEQQTASLREQQSKLENEISSARHEREVAESELYVLKEQKALEEERLAINKEIKKFQTGMNSTQKNASLGVDMELMAIQDLTEKLNNTTIDTKQYREIEELISQSRKQLELFREEAIEAGLKMSSVTGRMYLNDSDVNVGIAELKETGILDVNKIKSSAQIIKELADFESKLQKEESAKKPDNSKIDYYKQRISQLKELLSIYDKTNAAAKQSAKEVNKAQMESHKYHSDVVDEMKVEGKKKGRSLYSEWNIANMTDREAEVAMEISKTNVQLKKRKDLTEEEKQNLQEKLNLLYETINAEKLSLKINKEGYVERKVGFNDFISDPEKYATNKYLKEMLSSSTGSYSKGFDESNITNLRLATESTLQNIQSILMTGIKVKSMDKYPNYKGKLHKKPDIDADKDPYAYVEEQKQNKKQSKKDNKPFVYDETKFHGYGDMSPDQQKIAKKFAELKNRLRKEGKEKDSKEIENIKALIKEAEGAGLSYSGKKKTLYYNKPEEKADEVNKDTKAVKDNTKATEKNTKAKEKSKKTKSKDTKDTKNTQKDTKAVKDNTKATEENNKSKEKAKTKSKSKPAKEPEVETPVITPIPKLDEILPAGTRRGYGSKDSKWNRKRDLLIPEIIKDDAVSQDVETVAPEKILKKLGKAIKDIDTRIESITNRIQEQENKNSSEAESLKQELNKLEEEKKQLNSYVEHYEKLQKKGGSTKAKKPKAERPKAAYDFDVNALTEAELKKKLQAANAQIAKGSANATEWEAKRPEIIARLEEIQAEAKKTTEVVEQEAKEQAAAVSNKIDKKSSSTTTLPPKVQELISQYQILLELNNRIYSEGGKAFEQYGLNVAMALEKVEQKLSECGYELNQLNGVSGISSIDGFLSDDVNSFTPFEKFSEGMLADTPEVTAAASQLASIPEDVVRSILAIHSPSEVMRQLGLDTGNGFALGLMESSDAVKAAIQQMLASGKVTEADVKSLIGWDGKENGKSVYDRRKKENRNAWDSLQGALADDDLFNYKKQEKKFLSLNKSKELVKTAGLKDIDDNELRSLGEKVGRQWKIAEEAVLEYIAKKKEALNIQDVSGGSGLDETKEDLKEAIELQETLNAETSEYKTIQEVAYDAGLSGALDISKTTSIRKTKGGEKTSILYNVKDAYGNTAAIDDLGAVTGKKIKKTKEMISQEATEIKKLMSQISNTLSNSTVKDIGSYMTELLPKDEAAKVEKLRTAYLELLNVLESFENGVSDFSENEMDSIFENLKIIEKIKVSFSDVASVGKIDASQAKDLQSALNGIARGFEDANISNVKFTKNNKEMTYQILDANKMLNTYRLTVSKTGEVTRELVSSEKHLNLFQKTIAGLGNKISELFKYAIANISVYEVFNFVKQGVGIVQEFDAAMTELYKVSNDSSESLNKFGLEAYNIAKQVGSTGTEIINSAADWTKLGYEIDEASELAKNSNIYANVGDMDIDTATEHMISSVQAWKSEFSNEIEASGAIIDRYNEIGNNFAISSADIGSAMERSAAALKEGGNTLNESLGLITAGNIIQQDADTVANALKILSLRIRGAKADLEGMGEDTDGLAESSSKMRKELKALTGVDLMLDENNFKSTAQIIQELGEVWEDLTDTSQAATLELIAGKNRASTISGLIENYETIAEVIESAENATGSATKENERYKESIKGHIDLLQNQWQSIWVSDINREFINFFVDIGTNVLKLIDDFGILETAITAVATALNVKSMVNGNDGIFGIFTRIKETVETLRNSGGLFNGGVVSSGIGNDILQQLSMGYNANGQKTSGYASAIEELAKSYKEATAEANALQMVQDGLTESVIDDILATQNWSEAEREAAINSEAFRAAQTRAMTASNSDTAATWMNVAAKKALAVAAGLAKAALGALAGVLVSYLIEGAVKFFDSIITTEKEIVEAGEKAAETIKSLSDDFETTEETVSGMSERFAELAQGVDMISGKNISLNTEEYEEFLNLSNQLADLFPTLSRNYTENGDAIVQLSGDTNTMVSSMEALVEAERQLTNQKIASELPDLYAKVALNAGEYSEKLDGLNAKVKEYENQVSDTSEYANLFETIFGGGQYYLEGKDKNALYEIVQGYNEILQEYDMSIDMFSKSIAEGNPQDFDGYILSIKNVGIYDEDELAEAKAQISMAYDDIANTHQDEIDSLYSQIATTENEAKANYNSLVTSIMSWLTTDTTYSVMSDEMQAIVRNTITNLDFDGIIKQFGSENKDWREVTGYLSNNIIDALANASNKTEIIDAWNNLFTSSLSTMPVKEAKELIDKNVDIISKILPEDIDLKAQFGFDEYDIDIEDSNGESLRQKAEKVLKDEFEGNLDTLPLEDVKIAANLSVYLEENSLDFSELQTQIDNYKYLGRDGFIDSRDILGDLGIKYVVKQEVEFEKAFDLSTSLFKSNPLLLSKGVNEVISSSINLSKDSLEEFGLIFDSDFLGGVDDYISKINELKIALSKIEKGTFTDSNLEKLKDSFGESSIEADNLKGSIIKLIGSMNIDMISAFSSQFGLVDSSDDRKEIEKFMNSVIELADVVGNMQFSVDMDAQSASYENLATALSESVSATGLSAESVANLRDRYSELEDNGYNVDSMFELTANGIRLNREELNKLEAAYKNLNIKKLEGDMNSLRSLYETLNAQIENTTDAAQLQDLFIERDGLVQQMNDLGMLMSQYDGLSSAYNKWQTAQSAGNERDMYEGVISGFEEVKDELSRGWLDDSTVAFLELLSGKDLSTASAKELLDVYEQLGTAINSAGYSVQEWFTKDDNGNSTAQGVYRFLDTINASDLTNENGISLGDAVTKDEDGNYSFDFSVLDEYDKVTGELLRTGNQVIADLLNTSEETIQIMTRAADDAGFEVSLGGAYVQLSTLRDGAEEANAALNDLFAKGEGGTDYEFNLSATGEDLETELTKAQELFETFKNEDGTFNVEAEGYEETKEILWYLFTMKNRLNEPSYMNLQTDQVDEALQEPLRKIQEFEELSQNEYWLNITGDPNGELEKTKEQMESIVDYLYNLEDAELKKTIGIEGLTEDQIREQLENGTLEIPTTLAVDFEESIGDALKDISSLLQYQSGLITEADLKLQLGVELNEEEKLQQQINDLNAGESITIPVDIVEEVNNALVENQNKPSLEDIIDIPKDDSNLGDLIANEKTESAFDKIKEKATSAFKGVRDEFSETAGSFIDFIGKDNIDNFLKLAESYDFEISNFDKIQQAVTGLGVGKSFEIEAVLTGEDTERIIQVLKNEDGTLSYHTEIDGEMKELQPLFQGEELSFKIKPEIEDGENKGIFGKIVDLFSGGQKDVTTTMDVDANISENAEEAINIEDETVTEIVIVDAENNTSETFEEIEEGKPEDVDFDVTAHYKTEGKIESEVSVDEPSIPVDYSKYFYLEPEQTLKISAEIEGEGWHDIQAIMDGDGNVTFEAEIDGETEILELIETENGISFKITAEDEASEVINPLIEASIEDKIVKLVGKDEATPVIEIWNALSADPKFATLSAEDQATSVVEYWNSLTPEVKEAFINGTLTMTDATEEGTDSANANIDSVPLETNPIIKAIDLTSNIAKNITNSLNVLNGKTAHTYIVTHKQTVNDPAPKAIGTMISPARASGTAYNVLNTRPISSAYAGGNISLPADEEALVNELGTESIIRDGQWMLIPGGMHMEHLKKGDIVINAQQTKDLIEHGKTFGHARAYASGTLGGIRLSNAYAYSDKGGGLNWATVTGSVNKTSGSKNNSGNKGNNSNNNNNKNNSSDSAEEFEETLDWIEVKIARIEREIENLDQKASATYKSWSTRNKALVSEMSKVSDEIAIQQAGYKRYLEEANSVGLSDEYKKLVQSGEIDIEKITDEDLANKIQEYTEWYEKAIECKDATEDLKDTLAELARQKFDNVAKQYEDKLSAIEHEANIIDALISKTETSGHIVSSKYYDELIKQEQKTNSSLHKEYAALQAELAEAMETGNIKKGSEEWYAMQAEINAVQEAIIESDTAIIEFNNNIRQLEWDAFDRLQEQISNVATEAEFLIGLMEDSKLYDDNGQLTDTGMATMGLHGQNYATYMHQADKYAKEMKEIDKDLAKDPGNQDLIERRQELLELQRDSINAANDEKMAIRDMVEEGINLELEALQERIDKYKEAQDEAKSLYDYQKNISDQVKEISSLEKQMTAYQGDNSEENKQRVQQLKVQLEEARENLEETEMDHALEESQKMLDKLYEDYEEILNERLDNIDMLLEDMIDKINTNSSDISNTISEEADKVGYTLSESMRNIWSNEGDAAVIISKYGDNFCAQLTSVNNVLNAIAEHMGVMLKQEDKNAKSEIKKNQDKAVEPKKEESSNKTETTKKEDTKKENTKTIKVGGKINAGSAQIYDYAGDKSGERQYFRNDPIYTVLKESGDWIQVRHHKANSGIDGWFKKSDVKAYKTGGLVDETGLAWLDGTKGKPEMVLNAQDTKNLIELTDTLRKLSDADISSMMSNVPMFDSLTPIAPNFVPNNMAQNMNNIFNMTFELHDVTNGEQVINYLIKSDRFENAVKAMTVDRLAGGSKFSKSKYVK